MRCARCSFAPSYSEGQAALKGRHLNALSADGIRFTAIEQKLRIDRTCGALKPAVAANPRGIARRRKARCNIRS